MRRKTPPSLRGQLDAVVETADAAARWLRRPAPSIVASARTTALRARAWREDARRRAPELSFALREALEHSSALVIEAARWKAGPDAELAAAAESLRACAQSLARAVELDGERRAEALIEAKRWAADADRRRLGARARAHESAFFVDAAKRERLAVRVSDAAEALQQACDALAGSLGG